MLEFIGFADFAKLAEIEPPLPTIEGLPGSVTPLLFLAKALFYKGFGFLAFLLLLDKYPVKEWNGGKLNFISEKVIHLMRGQEYSIGGIKFFTMGGAESTDRKYRKEGKSWWPGEMPSDEEYEEALRKLAKHKCQARPLYDQIISLKVENRGSATNLTLRRSCTLLT